MSVPPVDQSIIASLLMPTSFFPPVEPAPKSPLLVLVLDLVLLLRENGRSGDGGGDVGSELALTSRFLMAPTLLAFALSVLALAALALAALALALALAPVALALALALSALVALALARHCAVVLVISDVIVVLVISDVIHIPPQRNAGNATYGQVGVHPADSSGVCTLPCVTLVDGELVGLGLNGLKRRRFTATRVTATSNGVPSCM